ncbi:polysaccharide pyruvyl transferase family protein [Sporosarcina sp. FSL W7-1283]|uniref:polysaccharide pyruvyl transferase family protein n=1 Tax=Sporosarcina sp. FSL W7-1283 TaxID=2921560 RepID=UPI0030FB2005
MKKVLYIGWIGYENLGDELMYDLFKEHFAVLGEGYSLDFVNVEMRYLQNISPSDYDLLVLGGGSILNGPNATISPYVIDFLYNAVMLNKKVMMWGSGIDWLPKSSISLLENPQGHFPFNIPDLTREKFRTVFSQSIWAGVRGPLSKEVFDRIDPSNGIEISGDPAFLLNPEKKRKPEQKIIGVNWGTSFNNVYGQDEEGVEDQLATALQSLIAQGYKVHLYIVWQKDLEASIRLYHKINDSDNVTMPTLYDQNELMARMQDFQYTINFKLHANYLSLAAQVPFIALGYRFKIYDFIKSIDAESLLVDMDSTTIAEDLLQAHELIVSNKDILMTKIETQRNLYAKRLLEPFAAKLYLH